MKTFFESKQRGELYHFTDIFGLIGMLSSGLMYAGFQRDWEVDRGYYFSLTRNHLLFNSTSSTKTASMFAIANIVLDGDAISENIKIVPFQSRKNKNIHKAEFEERVYSSKNTLPLDKYCKYVVVDLSRFTLDNLLFRGSSLSIRDKFPLDEVHCIYNFYLYLCSRFDVEPSTNLSGFLLSYKEPLTEEEFTTILKFIIKSFNKTKLPILFTNFPKYRKNGNLF